MWSRFSLRKNRRGYSIVEVVIAAGLMIIVMAAATALLTISGRMQQSTQMRSDTGQIAALAMTGMVQDIREAADVSIPTSYQMQIFYPVVDGAGYYDRFRTNTTQYIEYVRANAAGTASASGGYIWRKDQTGAGRPICSDVTSFSVQRLTLKSVRLTVSVLQTNGRQQSSVTLNQRVVFLRNQPD